MPFRTILACTFFLILGLTTLFSMLTIPLQVPFGYDQARDAFEAYSIWHDHNPKVMGPTSDIPGLNHGVLWYYYLALLYFITQHSIELTAFFSGTLILFTIPLAYYVSKKLTHNHQISMMTTIIYGCSPLFFAFIHWLSNPILALFVTPVLLTLLWTFIEKKSPLKVFGIGITFGLLIQSDFAFIVLLLLLPLYIYFFRLKITFKHIISFSLGLLLAMTTFIVSVIKFQIPIFQIALQFLSSPPDMQTAAKTLWTTSETFFNVFALTVLPFPKLVVLGMVILSISYFRKKLFDRTDKPLLFIELWLTGILILFLFNKGNLSAVFFLGPMLLPLAFFISYFATKIIKNEKILYGILACIVLSQILMIYTWQQQSYSPLAIQKDQTLATEKELIDYTYMSAEKKPFIINSVTSPLYINTTWAYLYEFYGKKTYGYLPFWGGRSQVGYLGNLPENPQNISLRFLIIENHPIIPKEWVARIIYDEDKITDVVERKIVGKFIVEKRMAHPNKPPIPIPAILKAHPKALNF